MFKKAALGKACQLEGTMKGTIRTDQYASGGLWPRLDYKFDSRKRFDRRIRSNGRNFLLLSHLTGQSEQTTGHTDGHLPIITVG